MEQDIINNYNCPVKPKYCPVCKLNYNGKLSECPICTSIAKTKAINAEVLKKTKKENKKFIFKKVKKKELVLIGKTKICTICKEEKDFAFFYKQAKLPDGHQNQCIACRKKQAEQKKSK